METCPECLHSYASVHMRQVEKELRLCCVCEGKAKDGAKARKKPKGNGEWIRWGKKSSLPFICLGFMIMVYIILICTPMGASVMAMARGKKAPVDELQASGGVMTLNLQGDVTFELGSSNLKPAAAASMEKVAESVRRYSTAKVTVRGYTDSLGSEKANLLLSRQRAESVRNWMAKSGHIPEAQIAVEGMGSKDPVAPNTNPDGSDNVAGREQNRRVTVTLTAQTEKSGDWLGLWAGVERWKAWISQTGK